MAAIEIAAVLDAGPLIYLDELGRLNLLADFKTLLVPQSVMREALRHRPELRLSSLPNCEIIPQMHALPSEMRTLAERYALHEGELAALALLAARHAELLLSDDTAARLVAQLLGFRTHGTLGLILRAFRLGRISRVEAVQILEELPLRTTLHLRREFLANVIAQIADKTR